MKKSRGMVYLVGGGPGDPGLLTVRGQELVRRADTVVVDALVNPVLLKRTKGQVIYVGKRGPGAPHGSSLSLPQEKINGLLVRLARQGKQVVRLKGGDPFVFGRGSEELEALRSAGIKFEVVPGITSAIAAPAYAGIPVTDRRWASQVTFVTGHGQAKTRGADPVAPDVDWKKLSSRGTLVILMGVASWPNIRRKLLSAGFPASRPVAAIESGTTSDQRVIRTTLQDSAGVFESHHLVSPAIIVIGDVVRLAERFGWAVPGKPLSGKRVAVTRPPEQTAELVSLLESRGADVISCPTIQIEPLRPALPLKSRAYDRIIFLSANAVRMFDAIANRSFKRIPATAVGFQTAAVAKEQGWRVGKTPTTQSSAGLLRMMGNVRGKRLLIPRVQNAPPGFTRELRRRGAMVEEITTYKTSPARLSAAVKDDILSGVDAVTFTSASTAKGFLRAFTLKQRKKIFKTAVAVSMGPQTSAALRRGGIRTISEAMNATLNGLIEAMENLK